MKPYGRNAARVLVEARKKKYYSQQEVSFLLGYKNGQFISNIERGKCNLPPGMTPKLCELLNIDPQVIKEAMIKDVAACLEYDLNLAFERSQHGNSKFLPSTCFSERTPSEAQRH